MKQKAKPGPVLKSGARILRETCEELLEEDDKVKLHDSYCSLDAQLTFRHNERGLKGLCPLVLAALLRAKQAQIVYCVGPAGVEFLLTQLGEQGLKALLAVQEEPLNIYDITPSNPAAQGCFQVIATHEEVQALIARHDEALAAEQEAAQQHFDYLAANCPDMHVQ